MRAPAALIRAAGNPSMTRSARKDALNELGNGDRLAMLNTSGAGAQNNEVRRLLREA